MAKHLGGNCQVQILYPFIDHPKNNPNFTGSHKYYDRCIFGINHFGKCSKRYKLTRRYASVANLKLSGLQNSLKYHTKGLLESFRHMTLQFSKYLVI